MDLSDFEKYLLKRMDQQDTKLDSISEKVTGLKSKVAMVSTIIGASLGAGLHYVLKKMGVQ